MSEEPLPPEVVRHVEHVLDALLLPGELDGWTVRLERMPGRPFPEPIVEVVVRGEEHRQWVSPPIATDEGAVGWLEAFTDGFEDFISESRFAWGQQRELRDRPWR